MKWYKVLIQGVVFAMFFVGMKYYILTEDLVVSSICMVIAGLGFYLTLDLEIEDKK
jgi:hypothetical protein